MIGENITSDVVRQQSQSVQLQASAVVPAITEAQPADKFEYRSDQEAKDQRQRQESAAGGKEQPESVYNSLSSGKQKESSEAAAQDLAQAVAKMNEHYASRQRALEFTVDLDRGDVVVKVKDKETDEVIRQIPSEEVMRLARHVKEDNESAQELDNLLPETVA